MKLNTVSKNLNYLCRMVVLDKLEKHPNADKLKIATICNSPVIVGIDSEPGDLYIYFPLECVINKELLSFINGFSESNLNKDTSVKGFFPSTGRVKAVKLRGIPSEGYALKYSMFTEWLGSKGVKEPIVILDKDFDSVEVNGESILICEKYVPKNQEKYSLGTNKEKKSKKKKFNRIIEGQFHFHVDTENLKRNIDKVNQRDFITVSYKLHGTSVVISNILVRRKLSLIEKVAKFFGAKINETEYDLIYSSRRVVQNAYEAPINHTPYYKENIWGMAARRISHAVEPGISIYAEIVGQLPNGSWIQKPYDYGVKEKDFGIYVYRITQTDHTGAVREFTTNQMVNYCVKHELNYVPVFFYGRAIDYPGLDGEHLTDNEFRERLLRILTEDYLEKKCFMCYNEVPAEGVVVTVEGNNFEAYKLKSFSFLERESKDLDSGNIGLEV